MVTRKYSYLARWLRRIVGLWVAGAMVVATSTVLQASAQSAEDDWATPQNLSQSGSAKNPAIVTDSDSTVHVVWQDAFANYVTAQSDGSTWSAPKITSLHLLFGVPEDAASAGGSSDESAYTGPNPVFVAGQRPYVFAFWVTPEGKLYSSRVLNRNFTNAAAWTTRKLLSEAVVAFSAIVDASGDIHVAYLRNLDATGKPAGVYHTRLRKFGLDWTVPELLYGSPYLRGLEGSQANVSLATGGTAEAPLLYLAWDNRPRKQVLVTKSADGGLNWEQPMLVDGPAPDSGFAGPYGVQVGASESSVVLIWQNGEPGGACNQLFRFSGDAGATWSTPQLMLESVPDCARTNEFVSRSATNPSALLYLLSNVQNRYVVSAWNGTRWSEPAPQPILAGFEDPGDFAQVVYACHRTAWQAERLYVVGCDNGGGADIWVTSREINPGTFLFTSSVWSSPLPITSDSLAVTDIEMVATDDNLVHAFFSQRNDSAIYYTRLDGGAWSRITPVLPVPDGEAGRPAVAVGPRNELILVTRSSDGSLYFSRANSRDAVMDSAWSPPSLIQLAHDGRVSPADVVWDAGGTVYVAYSVPVNEDRGVYVIRSADQGRTWSEPLRVFNGAAEGHDFVGAPTMLELADGSIHILWSQQSINADGLSEPLALHHAGSEDAGVTFGEAARLVEAPVGWQEIVADGKGNLHGLWQPRDVFTTLWDQVSTDEGHTWQAAQRLPSEDGAAAVTVDPAGRLHLIGVGQGSLSHWLWDGIRWQAEAAQRWSLAQPAEAPPGSLGTALNHDGKLVVVWSMAAGTDEVDQTLLLYTTRTLEMPPPLAVVQVTATQTPPLPTVTATAPPAQPSSTPVATAAVRQTPVPVPSEPVVNASNPVAEYAMFLLPVALLLFVFLFIVAFRIIQTRFR